MIDKNILSLLLESEDSINKYISNQARINNSDAPCEKKIINGNDLTHNLELPSPEKYQCKINEVSIETLFEKYKDNGFLYPEKYSLLSPYLPKITKNWETLLKENKNLWIVTNEVKNTWASVCHWQTTNSGWLSQHLTSNNKNPLGSCLVMLCSQAKVYNENKNKSIQTFQNWYRPNNKYANRLYSSITQFLPAEEASVDEYSYFLIDKKEIINSNSDIVVTNLNSDNHSKFLSFIKKERSSLYIKAEELDSDDVDLNKLNNSYEKSGLFRYRKIILALDSKKNIIGAALIYRGPLGLNFSFLENKSEIIISKKINNTEKLKVTRSILSNIKKFYLNFPLKIIPVITDINTSKYIIDLGFKIMRNYNKSVWTQKSFLLWYLHVYNFYKPFITKLLEKFK